MELSVGLVQWLYSLLPVDADGAQYENDPVDDVSTSHTRATPPWKVAETLPLTLVGLSQLAELKPLTLVGLTQPSEALLPLTLDLTQLAELQLLPLTPLVEDHEALGEHPVHVLLLKEPFCC